MSDTHERIAERQRIKAHEDKLLIETFIEVEILEAARTLAKALTKSEPVGTEVIEAEKPANQRHFWKELFGKSSSTEPLLSWLCVKYATFSGGAGRKHVYAHTVSLREDGVIVDRCLGFTSLYGDGQSSKPSSIDAIISVYGALATLNKKHHLRATRNLFKKIPRPVMDVFELGTPSFH